jgi:16S rRNA C967 or C1407 C5-methylase (RsmB/RsmF family)
VEAACLCWKSDNLDFRADYFDPAVFDFGWARDVCLVVSFCDCLGLGATMNNVEGVLSVTRAEAAVAGAEGESAGAASVARVACTSGRAGSAASGQDVGCLDALPDGLGELLTQAYGVEQALRVAQGYSGPRAMTFRANTLKSNAREVAAALETAHIDWSPVDFYADAFVVDVANDAAVRALDIYMQGEIYVQNLSAMLPALALGPAASENILDMAAAPGGKTSQLAALSEGRANITACEKNAVRAERLKYNLQKQGAGRVVVLQQDARKLDEFFVFDKVLLDSPCSGSGTIRLNGEGVSPALAGASVSGAAGAGAGARVGGKRDGRASKNGFSRELLARVARTQRELLRRALSAVRPGGLVVYATCSVLPMENEQAILDALDPQWTGASEGAGAGPSAKRRGKGGKGGAKSKGRVSKQVPFNVEAEIIPVSDKLLTGVPTLPCALEGAVCVAPTELYEGFFLAILERKS